MTPLLGGDGTPRMDGVRGAGGGGGAPTISVRSRVNGRSVADTRRRTLDRYAGRAMARRMLDGAGLADLRIRRCGFRLGGERVFKVGADGKARSVGVERCAQGRACSVCGPAQAAVRAAEVGAGTWRWMTSGAGRSAVFVSVAASHRRTDKLDDLHQQLLEARGKLMHSSSPEWRRFRKHFGVFDLAWKIEHSIGANGPHPGLHFVLLTERWWTAEDAQSAEAWLVLGLRRELAAAGFTGRLSVDRGVDITPVDDPAGVGRYLAKWGVGRELAAETDKLGRNGENVPYAAIPAILAEELGRRDPHSASVRRNPQYRRMVGGWCEFVRLATSDTRRWYRGFRKLRELVPELVDAHRPNERVAVCTDLLPEELRPERLDDLEDSSDVDGGQLLTIDSPAWEAAQMAWWRADRLPWVWAQRRRSWLDGHVGSPIPLELAVAWIIEDEGLSAAADAVAGLCGGEIAADDIGMTITIEDGVALEGKP